jgi:hypothetical protein
MGGSGSVIKEKTFELLVAGGSGRSMMERLKNRKRSKIIDGRF